MSSSYSKWKPKGKDYMKIGILEDNPSILHLMQNALELVGHTTFTHTRGQSFLNIFLEKNIPLTASSFPYDLLIVDLNLPGEPTGVEVIAFVNHLFAPHVPPILIASAASIEQLESLHNRFPTLPIIRKPFAIQAFLQSVSSVLSAESTRRRETQIWVQVERGVV